MADKNEVFVYSYSAEEQDIVRKIRQKYMPEEENKMEQLIKLDKSTRTMGRVAAITLGIVSTLVFGTGMCCVLEWDMFILGVIIGMIDLLHIGQRTYSDYESGKTRIPVDSLIILAKYYNVTLDYISGISDIKNKYPLE